MEAARGRLSAGRPGKRQRPEEKGGEAAHPATSLPQRWSIPVPIASPVTKHVGASGMRTLHRKAEGADGGVRRAQDEEGGCGCGSPLPREGGADMGSGHPTEGDGMSCEGRGAVNRRKTSMSDEGGKPLRGKGVASYDGRDSGDGGASDEGEGGCLIGGRGDSSRGGRDASQGRREGEPPRGKGGFPGRGVAGALTGQDSDSPGRGNASPRTASPLRESIIQQGEDVSMEVQCH